MPHSFNHRFIQLPSWTLGRHFQIHIKYGICCSCACSNLQDFLCWPFCVRHSCIFSLLILYVFLSHIFSSILKWLCSEIRAPKPPVDLLTTDSWAHHRTYCCFISPVKSSLRGSSLVLHAES